MILSPVPPGLLPIIGPLALPHQLLFASRVPVWPPAEASRPARAFPTKQFVCAVTPVLGPTPKPAKGFSTKRPRCPLRSMFPLTAMLLFPPNRSMVPELLEPMLLLPVIVLLLTKRKAIPSGVPATSSLLLTARPLEATTTRTELFVSPLNLLLSIVALHRPKLVWMPLPEPAPGLLLFWIRLNWTSAGAAAQVESNSMPEILFWTMLLSI